MAVIERLKQLRRMVVELPPRSIRMDGFNTIKNRGCRTIHCVAGWMPFHPWFVDHTPIHKLFRVKGSEAYYRHELGTEGLAGFFGIAIQDARHLFGTDIHETGQSTRELRRASRADVLANIDRIIAGQPAQLYDCMEAAHV